jgi:hypothetical protein
MIRRRARLYGIQAGPYDFTVVVGATLVVARIERSSMNGHGAVRHPGRDKPCPYNDSK